jgi:peptide chain release factor subunit 1
MATSNSVKQHKLRKLIARLSDKEGKGKEFISLYLPNGTAPDEIVAILKEKSDSVAMKSRSIKVRLQEALKSVNQRLKLQKQIPLNGLVIFAGTFASSGSEHEALNVEEVAPPEPVNTYLLEVEDHFLLDPLRVMVRGQRVVGLLALDSKEASFGIFKGENLEIMESISSGISGKSGKGGSSQRRYERERDMAVTYFFHRIAEHATKTFLQTHRVTVLLVGGPGHTKEDFLKGDFLHYELKNLLLGEVNTQSAGKEALKEVLDKSSEVLKNMCAPEERNILQRLLTHIGQDDGLAIAGLDLVLEGLKNGEVETALATDRTNIVDIVVTCKRCGMSMAKIADKAIKVQTVQEMISVPCERCHALEYTVEERDIVDVLEDLASQTNAKVEVISTESEEKAKLTSFGGFAAILRYRNEKVA